MPSQRFADVKKSILDAVAAIRAECPEAAEYLERHLVFDEATESFCYTGDDRLKIVPGVVGADIPPASSASRDE